LVMAWRVFGKHGDSFKVCKGGPGISNRGQNLLSKGGLESLELAREKKESSGVGIKPN